MRERSRVYKWSKKNKSNMVTMHILLHELLQKQIAQNGNRIKKPFPFNMLDSNYESKHELAILAKRLDKTLYRLTHAIFQCISSQTMAD